MKICYHASNKRQQNNLFSNLRGKFIENQYINKSAYVFFVTNLSIRECFIQRVEAYPLPPSLVTSAGGDATTVLFLTRAAPTNWGQCKEMVRIFQHVVFLTVTVHKFCSK